MADDIDRNRYDDGHDYSDRGHHCSCLDSERDRLRSQLSEANELLERAKLLLGQAELTKLRGRERADG